MKILIPTLACLSLAACGKKPVPMADSPNIPPPPPRAPAAAAGPSGNPGTGNGSAATAPTPTIQLHPTLEQRREVAATLARTLAAFQAGQQAMASARAKVRAEWNAIEARTAGIREQSEAVLGNPAAGEEDRAKAMDTLARLRNDPAPLPAMPPLSDPEADQAFDAMIYQFRQAVAAHDHAKAMAVVQKMGELGGSVSPQLMTLHRMEVERYLSEPVPAP